MVWLLWALLWGRPRALLGVAREAAWNGPGLLWGLSGLLRGLLFLLRWVLWLLWGWQRALQGTAGAARVAMLRWWWLHWWCVASALLAERHSVPACSGSLSASCGSGAGTHEKGA